MTEYHRPDPTSSELFGPLVKSRLAKMGRGAQSQMARDLDISPRAVSYFLNGHGYGKFRTVVRMLRYVGLELYVRPIHQPKPFREYEEPR